MAGSYRELITGVCKLINMTESQSIIKGRSFVLNDVPLTLIHRPEADARHCYLFAVFGALPDQHQAEILEELLRQNHPGFGREGVGFMLSPVTRNVGYSRRISIDGTSARDLANLLLVVVDKAREWRKGFFLDDSLLTGTRTSRSDRK